MSSCLVELIEVSKRYGSADDDLSPQILNGINLRVGEGQSLAVVGPSGSGKTTLLNIIGTLDRPSSGRALFEGTDLAELNDDELAAIRNRKVGFVFQLHHLLPQCTALENVLVPTLTAGSPGKATVTRAKELLERVGLIDRMAYRPGQLSGGQCQRITLVRALINDPKLVLADEPTGSLDRAASANLAELLVELNREQGTTLIVVTHSVELAGKMDRVLQLCDGVLVSGKGEP